MSLEIRPATTADRRDWRTLADATPDSTPFHLPGWCSVLARTLGHRERHLVAERDGEMVGVLPMIQIDSVLTGRRLVSTPLAGYGGPLTGEPEVADALVDAAVELTREAGADHLELHFDSEQTVAGAAAELPSSDLYAGFCEKLPDDPDEVISWVPRKSRRMCRLGVKAGLEGKMQRLGDDPRPEWLADAHRLVATTMRDLGTPSYSLGMLRGLLQQDEDWGVWTCHDDDRMVAAVWVARHGDCLYPHFSGADREYRKVGVNNFLYSSLMEHGVSRGAHRFDFGRSKVDSGPYHFKRHFGFEPRPLGYRYFLAEAEEVPAISPSNPRYGLAIRLWRRLPLPITRTLGPALVGHFA